MPFVRELAVELDSGRPYTRHRRKVTEWLVEIYRIMDEGGMFFSGSEKTALVYAIDRFLLHYSWLSAHAARTGFLEWNYTPKHHYLVHVGLMGDLLNPKVVQNYRDESLVGVTAALCAANANGRWALTIQRRTLQRYLVGLQILLGDSEAPA